MRIILTDAILQTNLKWYMDTEFYHRLLLKYKEPIFLHKVLVVNYLHSDQVSNTQINNIGDQNAYLINGATGTHDTGDPKIMYG